MARTLRSTDAQDRRKSREAAVALRNLRKTTRR